jgi:hypothetical protein
MSKFKIGDKIRDIEDGDCYYTGIWQGNDTYILTSIVWIGFEIEDEQIGKIICQQWWVIELDN